MYKKFHEKRIGNKYQKQYKRIVYSTNRFFSLWSTVLKQIGHRCCYNRLNGKTCFNYNQKHFYTKASNFNLCRNTNESPSDMKAPQSQKQKSTFRIKIDFEKSELWCPMGNAFADFGLCKRSRNASMIIQSAWMLKSHKIPLNKLAGRSF